MANPTCFISYSWDSEEHKEWVRNIAEALQRRGVWTYLDQWDINPGSDLTGYMESKIRESDYVLLVCTPDFAKKANLQVGGVGYEKVIVSGEIFQNISKPEKFIPIIRSGDSRDSLPSYLMSKLFVDFREDNEFGEKLEELLRHMHKVPKYIRPELGEPPDFETDFEPDLKEKKEEERENIAKEAQDQRGDDEDVYLQKRDPFFIKYKKEFYDLLKKEGFELIEENLHNKLYIYRDGEKLNLAVEETAIYNEKTRKDEHYFVILREYIGFEKNDRGEFKKVIKTEKNKIHMNSRFQRKRIGFKLIISRMENHLSLSEIEIEKSCRKAKKIREIITIFLIVAIIIIYIWIILKN